MQLLKRNQRKRNIDSSSTTKDSGPSGIQQESKPFSQQCGCEPAGQSGKGGSITAPTLAMSRPQQQSIELGTIQYVNLTPDGRHGDYDLALRIAKETGKPIFTNFVEWSGCQGCQDAGAHIFSDPTIRHVAETYFVPCAFNTWDRYNRQRNMAMRQWAGRLQDSDWGYLRLVSSDGQTILSGTSQITGGGPQALQQVKTALRQALVQLGISDVPKEL